MKSKAKRFLSCILASALLAGVIPAASAAASAAQNEQPQESDVVIRNTNGVRPMTEEDAENLKIIGSLSEYEAYTAKVEGTKPQAGTAYTLATKFDNSTNQNSIYLPPVGDQGGISSCVAWAAVYYQYTYTINKARGVSTTTANTYSPNFAYNHVNESCDWGTWSNRVYELLKTQGVPTIKDVPIATDNTYGTNYLNWHATGDIWEHALNNRILDYVYYYSGEESQVFYSGGGSYLSMEEPAIKSPDDDRLKILKKAISDGKILIFDSNIEEWNENIKIKNCNAASTTQNPRGYKIDNSFVGENVATLQGYIGGRMTGHEMTIVGYNDEIWTDINGNNVVDEGEMGAFKMLNSWGKNGAWYLSATRKIDNNAGYLWIAYDALNYRSAVNGADTDRRECILHGVGSISVDPEQSNKEGYNLVYTLNGFSRDSCPVTITAKNKKTGDSYSENAFPLNYVGYHGYGHIPYNYLGKIGEPAEGHMTIDLEKIVPDIAAYGVEGYDWSITVGNYTNGETMKVKEMYISDKKNSKVYPMNAEPGFSFTEDSKTVTIPVSDDPVPKNEVTIYYSGYSTPYIHYQIETGTWTDVPGKAMTATSEVSGYTHKYTIDLGTKSYANVCFNNGGSQWDSKNGANYRFTTGTYTFKNGTITAYEPPKPKELSAEIGLSTKNVPTNCSVSVSAVASGGTAPYQYKFSYVKDSKEYVISNYSSSASASFTPDSEGTYKVKVIVKDSAGKTVTKETDLTAVKVTLRTISADRSSIKVGETVKFTASVVKGNADVSCSYNIKGTDTEQTIAANKDFSADWKPAKEGEYTVTVNVRYGDKLLGSLSIKYTVNKGADVTLNEVTIYYKGYSTPYIHYQIGTGTWTAVPGKEMLKTSEVSGYTHKYTIDLGTNSYANVCFNNGGSQWDSRNGANYTFTKGVFTYSNGTISAYNPPAPKELSASIKLSQNIIPQGQSIAVTGSASGGTAPYQYKFSYILNGTEKGIRSYSTVNNANFTPSSAGDFTVKVTVKDAVGTEVSKTAALKVSTVKINSLTADKTTIKTGDTVKLKASVTAGGVPVTYSYTVSGNNATKTLSLNTDNSANWIPDDTGSYTVTLKLMYNGTAAAEKSVSFTVEKGIDIVVNSTTIYYKGYSTPYIHYQVGSGAWTDVPGKAMISTSEKPGYTHKYTIDLGSADYVNVCFNNGSGQWDSRGGANYRFEKGTYTYQNGSMNKISGSGSTSVYYNVLNNTSALSKTAIKAGESFKVRASAEGGTAPYTYAVYYKKSTSSNWTTKQSFKTNAVTSITPASAASYDVCVKVKDASGTVSKKYFTVNVAAELKTNATMSSDNADLGTAVKLRAAATGGTGNYTYAFCYKKTGSSSWKTVRSYSTTNYVNIKPAEKGTYEVCIKAKDSSGTIAKTYFTLKVK